MIEVIKQKKKKFLVYSCITLLVVGTTLAIALPLSLNKGKGGGGVPGGNDYSKGVALTDVKPGDDIGGFKLKYDKSKEFSQVTWSDSPVFHVVLVLSNDSVFQFKISQMATTFQFDSFDICYNEWDDFNWTNNEYLEFPAGVTVSNIDWSYTSDHQDLFDFCAAQKIFINL